MREQLLRDIEELELSQYKDIILSTLRPALEIKRKRNDYLPIGRSKFGGKADLPPGMLYPTGGDGKPLLFLAQYYLEDFVSFPFAHDLPSKGMLYFFCFDDDEEPGGCMNTAFHSDWACVIYWNGDLATLQPYEAGETVRVYPQAEIWFEEALSGLSFCRDRIDHADEDAFIELWESYDGYRHQLLGFPVPQQPWEISVTGPLGDREKVKGLQEEFEGYILLLQADCDGELDMSWGDCGTLYFMLSFDDLRKHAFENFLFTGQHG